MSSGYSGYSGNSGGGSSYGASSYSSYGHSGSSGSGSSHPSGNGSNLHHKKDGSLDMRYASSKQAVATLGGYGGYSGGSTSGYSASHSPAATALHYKKDGTPDMRYSSSKQAAAAPSGVSSGNSGSSGLHYKKDGSLDMRYSSSKQAVGSGVTVAPDLHFKKDGSLDMRYGSSRAAAGLTAAVNKMQLSYSSSRARSQTGPQYRDIPDYVPKKKDGTPDMRTRAAKDWVASQAAQSLGSGIPNWVPKKKDGSVNMQTAVGRAYAEAIPDSTVSKREDYWISRMNDDIFSELVQYQRQQYVAPATPQPIVQMDMPYDSYRSYTRSTPSSSYVDATFDTGLASLLPENIPQIEYSSLVFDSTGEKGGEIGRGSFGIVLRAKWRGMDVAVKKLHLDQLSKKEKESFRKELMILANLGVHRNLVRLHGYCLNPPCIVMELISLGSLTHLLHYSEDPAVEAKMTDGRIKKNLVFGIADGMRQLHAAKIIHCDLKPQNVLVSDDYDAKITDFGLSALRGKISSTVASKNFDDNDGEAFMVGGTAGYMAPELLDSTSPPDFSSDVYSFGIVLNEVIMEEEPYSDQYANFAGRGPFGAANYAKQGKRPTVSQKTPKIVENLIRSCWAADPTSRPTFEEIVNVIDNPNFTIPDSM
jgi:tRNA A-37 threonylcarbamoyl transferase component Bud32